MNSLSLYGANGYNNAVYLIKEMCETLYSGNQGTTTCLTIEDLEDNYFSDAAITTRNNFKSEVNYRETKYYSGSYAKYPNIAPEEVRMGITTTLIDGKNQIRTGGLGLSQQTTTYTGSGDANASTVATTNKGITVTQTYYYISQGDDNYKNAILNNIIHKSPTANGADTTEVSKYWLDSRCVDPYSKRCYFSVRYVYSSSVYYDYLFSSFGGAYGSNYAVRPVITLNSGIQAEYSAKYNDTYNTWTIN